MSGKQKQVRTRPSSVNWSDLAAVPDFEGYFITPTGRIFSVSELKTFEDEDGYIRTNAYKKGKLKRPAVHVWLAKAYLPPGDKDQTLVRHLDGNKKNLDLTNLAWGTPKQNGEDKAKHGSVKGTKNPKAKLTENDVAQIKKLLKTSTIKAVAAQFPKVSQSTIEAISSGQNWGHVSPAT